eukprot:TRINITY_DN6112_c0_g1_i1.p1 TRINITY_DN6112_c0_g1~~TRINITY_DN6112_c0_g1_i1.p1  ORF type:complete len:303 (-),score=20.81 TRINITY_DN6112_c0_g1_i1:327-1235(-)
MGSSYKNQNFQAAYTANLADKYEYVNELNNKRKERLATYTLSGTLHYPEYSSDSSANVPTAPELSFAYNLPATGVPVPQPQPLPQIQHQYEQAVEIGDTEASSDSKTSGRESKGGDKKRGEKPQRDRRLRFYIGVMLLAGVFALILAGVVAGVLIFKSKHKNQHPEKQYDGILLGFDIENSHFCFKYKNTGQQAAVFDYEMSGVDTDSHHHVGYKLPPGQIQRVCTMRDVRLLLGRDQELRYEVKLKVEPKNDAAHIIVDKKTYIIPSNLPSRGRAPLEFQQVLVSDQNYDTLSEPFREQSI